MCVHVCVCILCVYTLPPVCRSGKIWHTHADSSRKGSGLATQGAYGSYGVTNSKVYETTGPIGTKFGTHLWIRLGLDIA